jgi:hypothetical protein
VRVRIAYGINRFLDYQRGDLQPEPASRMAVGSEDPFHFILLVDGRYGGFGVFVETQFRAQRARIDPAQLGAAAFELLKQRWNAFNASIPFVLKEERRVGREVKG